MIVIMMWREREYTITECIVVTQKADCNEGVFELGMRLWTALTGIAITPPGMLIFGLTSDGVRLYP